MNLPTDRNIGNPYGPVTDHPALPPGYRATAYWWSVRRGLPVTLDCLKELGAVAAWEARWAGLEAMVCWEGPFLVHTWPDWIWITAEQALRDRCADRQARFGPRDFRPGYHGEGELAGFDPGTGRSSWDDWGR